MEDPTFDIDHADFNAQEYFKFFVKDKNVQDLLKKNNNLFSGLFIFALYNSISKK
jgi:hypothetical protein